MPALLLVSTAFGLGSERLIGTRAPWLVLAGGEFTPHKKRLAEELTPGDSWSGHWTSRRPPSGLVPACHPPVSQPHVIDAQRWNPALSSLRWSSRSHDAAMVLMSLSSVPHHSLLPFKWLPDMVWCVLQCLGGCGISVPPQPCAAAACLALPCLCPPTHLQAAAATLLGLESRFCRSITGLAQFAPPMEMHFVVAKLVVSWPPAYVSPCMCLYICPYACMLMHVDACACKHVYACIYTWAMTT